MNSPKTSRGSLTQAHGSARNGLMWLNLSDFSLVHENEANGFDMWYVSRAAKQKIVHFVIKAWNLAHM